MWGPTQDLRHIMLNLTLVLNASSSLPVSLGPRIMIISYQIMGFVVDLDLLLKACNLLILLCWPNAAAEKIFHRSRVKNWGSQISQTSSPSRLLSHLYTPITSAMQLAPWLSMVSNARLRSTVLVMVCGTVRGVASSLEPVITGTRFVL